ncbi:hypothetical protein TanjilG_18971 [Lupinus angustifolius]|uniref:Hyccin n=1 Tax=Lupinus angustifolius TaxID=3871 RepID=A0A4P1RRH6_LUPAN|nr:PREDICTED: uncharacterized protein LOC109340946 [Lupinus angustifolius]OIW16256.1 hypothetical protein TanjilG_18971 [Lupinus angustifolius]
MSNDEATVTTTPSSSVTTTTTADSLEKIQSAFQSLSTIIPTLSSSSNNPLSLLLDHSIYSHISSLLRDPNSGSGDNNLCRWLYDTIQSGVPDLHLLVLRFLPVIAGVYLSRIPCRKPQAGFEAVLLALYAHETTARAGQAVTVSVPDLSQPSVYHESKVVVKNNSTDLNLAVLSPTLEPHGTVRSSRRARIVGVALELFYSKISQIPIEPKIDFCEFCKIWAGQDGDMYKNFEEEEEGVNGEGAAEEEGGLKEGGGDEVLETEEEKSERKKIEGRVPLPWELLQPVLRILAHCLLGPNNKDKVLFEAANEACRCLFARAMHDVNAKAILPTRSLLRLSKSVVGNVNDVDPTELPISNVISL